MNDTNTPSGDLRIIKGPTSTPSREERRGRTAPPDNGTIVPTPRYQAALARETKHARVTQGITDILEVMGPREVAIALHNRAGESHSFDPTKPDNAQSVLRHYLNGTRPSDISDEKEMLKEISSILQHLQAAAGRNLQPEAEAESDPFRELKNLSRLVLGNMHSIGPQHKPVDKSAAPVPFPG